MRGSGLSSTCEIISAATLVFKKITTASKNPAIATSNRMAENAGDAASNTRPSNQAMGSVHCTVADMILGMGCPIKLSAKAIALAAAKAKMPAGKCGLRSFTTNARAKQAVAMICEGTHNAG